MLTIAERYDERKDPNVFSLKRAALALSVTALATGTMLAIPATAMAATSPSASSAVTSTHAFTAEAYEYWGTYSRKAECENVGLVYLMRGAIRDYHCSGAQTEPGGGTVVWNLWVLP